MWATMLGVAVAYLLLAYPLLTGKVFVNNDLANFHLPTRFEYARAMEQGETPFWTQNMYGGFYMHGEGQVGMLHPVHWLLYRTLPLQIAFNLEIIFGYILMTGGLFFMFRRLGFERQESLLGAILITFALPHSTRIKHTNVIQIVAHYSWMLGTLDVLYRTARVRNAILAQLGLTLMVASQWLLGHPQATWYGFVLVACFGAWRLRSAISWWRPLGLVMAYFSGTLIGAAQLLPTLDAVLHSQRSKPDLNFLLYGAISPFEFVRLWAGDGALYLSAFPIVALFWLWIRRKEIADPNHLIRGCLIFTIVTLMLCFGLFYQIIARVPPYSFFRMPTFHILLFQIAIFTISLIAFKDMVHCQQTGICVPLKRLWPFLALFPLVLPILLISWWTHRNGIYPWWIILPRWEPLVVGFGVIVSLTLLWIAGSRGYAWGIYGVCLLAVGELCVRGVRIVQAEPPLEISSVLEISGVPPDYDNHRIYAPALKSAQNRTIMAGCRNAWGYVALTPMTHLDWESDKTYRVAEVGWLYDKDHWVKSGEPLPRCRLVGDALVSQDIQTDLEKIDPDETVLLDQKVVVSPGTSSNVSIALDDPGKIEVNVTTDTDQVLVLSERYHSGWKIKVDGQDAKLLRAYGDFMACAIPAGTHLVKFRFDPALWKLGKLLAGTGLLFTSFISLGAMVWVNRQSKKDNFP